MKQALPGASQVKAEDAPSYKELQEFTKICSHFFQDHNISPSGNLALCSSLYLSIFFNTDMSLEELKYCLDMVYKLAEDRTEKDKANERKEH